MLVADDVALLSPRVNGLQRMISIMEDYSKTWRFEFNIKKSGVVVFGETTRAWNSLKKSRKWLLYGKPIAEDSTIEHVGIILSGSFSGNVQTAEAVAKGREVVSSLMTAGIPLGVINPICGRFIWHSIGLPKMLYGAELWCQLTNTNILSLE